MYRFLIIAFPSIFYDKTVKALYSLKRNVLSLNPSLYTSLHIFFIILSNSYYYAVLKFFVRLFDLRLFGFVGFLFLLVSGKGCGL